MALGHQRRASFLALAALAAVFSLLPRYIPDIAWVTTVPFQLLLSARPYASPRRTETGMRSAPSDLDPAVAEKLKAAQERISQAKQAMAVLRNELCGRNFFSPEIDRSLLIEVLRLFAPESAKPMREPILQKELINMIPDMRQDTEALAALINAMATVRLAYEPAWQLLADVVVEECSSASGRQLVAFAWAFATAGEPRQDLWTALKSMMAGKRKELSAEERVTFAWSCAEVGQHATELFGEASEVAAEKLSRFGRPFAIWMASICSRTHQLSWFLMWSRQNRARNSFAWPMNPSFGGSLAAVGLAPLLVRMRYGLHLLRF
ncbi:Pentatricopeptide repeat-containing protein [Durusdinium trenchii]|uniref:Chloroplastic n=1 Tax=Durusdinium trenchii TaxID=1381693 RepID=A0ABP0J3C6_9DINO